MAITLAQINSFQYELLKNMQKTVMEDEDAIFTSLQVGRRDRKTWDMNGTTETFWRNRQFQNNPNYINAESFENDSDEITDVLFD